MWTLLRRTPPRNPARTLREDLVREGPEAYERFFERFFQRVWAEAGRRGASPETRRAVTEEVLRELVLGKVEDGWEDEELARVALTITRRCLARHRAGRGRASPTGPADA